MADSTATNNKALIDRVNQSFIDNDTEAFLACCADEIVWAMAGAPPNVGKDAIRAFMAPIASGKGPTFRIDTNFATEAQGTSTGIMHMPSGAGGKSYEFADIYTFKDGKVVTLMSFLVEVG